MSLNISPKEQQFIDSIREYIEQNGTFEFARRVKSAVIKLPDGDDLKVQHEIMSGIIDDMFSVRNEIA